MSEKLNQASHCVHEENTGLSIWWVDDCFTNERVANDKAGGFLPIEDVRHGQVNPAVHLYSGHNYNMLLKIAEEEKVSFYVCSFEYAQANWGGILNKPTNLLLIDIGYEGKHEGQTYGIDFYLRMIEKAQLHALLVFLTVDILRVSKWISTHAHELPYKQILSPCFPFPLQKMRDDSNGIPGPPEKEVKGFVRMLKNLQETPATKWELGIWKALRKKALAACKKLADAEDITHPFWAHHLPHGGDAWSDEERVERLTNYLCDELNSVLPVMKLPRHRWESEDSTKYGWQRPSIRALSQFDSNGKDLTAIFQMIWKKAANISNIMDINILFLPGYQLTHDYLWFNACALAQGLYELAESFAQEVKKQKHNDKPWDWRGHISWLISETTENEKLGLHVQIYQTFIAWNREDKKHPCLLTKRCRLPQISTEQGSVLSVYNFFRRAGVNFNIESDGSLNPSLSVLQTN